MDTEEPSDAASLKTLVLEMVPRRSTSSYPTSKNGRWVLWLMIWATSIVLTQEYAISLTNGWCAISSFSCMPVPQGLKLVFPVDNSLQGCYKQRESCIARDFQREVGLCIYLRQIYNFVSVFSLTTCWAAFLICGSLARGGGVCMTRWRRWQLRGNCDPDFLFRLQTSLFS